jgi:UDP-N-acetylmuramoyl-tripeptide--D-alanyl-D-alanine ligase
MTDPLWTFSDIAKATEGTCANDGEAYGVSIDSRTIRSGDVFLAFKGENQDGHAYAGQAVAKGAAGVIISDPVEGLPKDLPVVQVKNTRDALVMLGNAARSRTNAKIVGVTGSVGKTGTKEALYTALLRSGATHASERSYNNDIGVPLTLARMPASTDFAVLEMGMNHAGEVRELTAMARPDVAVITNIESVHAEFFDSVEAIANAKAEIFEGMTADSVAVLNRDNAYYDHLAKAAKAQGVDKIVTFGEAEDSDIRLLKSFEADDCSTVSALIDGELMTYRIGVPGAHWVKNSLAVLAVVHVLGADLGFAGLGMGEMVAPKGRGRRHWVNYRDGVVLVIDESYNASPVSMRAAINDLGRANGRMPDSGIPGRKIAVLGDMLELGSQSEQQHHALAEQLGQAGIDLVFTVGTAIEALDVSLQPFRKGGHAADCYALIPHLMEQLQPGDVVMAKGSNALGLSAVIDALVTLDEDQSARQLATG